MHLRTARPFTLISGGACGAMYALLCRRRAASDIVSHGAKVLTCARDRVASCQQDRREGDRPKTGNDTADVVDGCRHRCVPKANDCTT